MSETTNVAKAKKQVTSRKFEIEVEKEAAHLMYQNGMGKEKADAKAREVITELFEVV